MRCYLYGNKFTLLTDHSAVRWLLNLKDPRSRLTRWSFRLAEFDYKIVHKPGRKLVVADALSRYVNRVFCDDNLTTESLQDAQNKDSMLTSHKESPEFITKDDGLLYRVKHIGKEVKLTIWVPNELVQLVLQYYHATPFSGHKGIQHTISSIIRNS